MINFFNIKKICNLQICLHYQNYLGRHNLQRMHCIIFCFQLSRLIGFLSSGFLSFLNSYFAWFSCFFGFIWVWGFLFALSGSRSPYSLVIKLLTRGYYLKESSIFLKTWKQVIWHYCSWLESSCAKGFSGKD